MRDTTDRWRVTNRAASVCSIVTGLGWLAQLVWPTIKPADAKVSVWLLVSASITASAFGFILGRFIFRKEQITPVDIIPELVGVIEFQYLPSPPTEHGWTLQVENKEDVSPVFRSAIDAPSPGSISIVSRGSYYLDYHLDPSLSFSDVVECAIKPGEVGTLYLRVRVKTADNSANKSVWIAHTLGTGKPTQSGEEWGIEIPGSHVGNGWRSIRCLLRDEVRATCGQEGWIYDQVLCIRIRGTLSISPIKFYCSEGS